MTEKPAGEAPPSASHVARRRGWDAAITILSLSAALAVSMIAAQGISSPVASTVTATVIVWAGLLLPVLILRPSAQPQVWLRLSDVLLALAFGIALRAFAQVVQAAVYGNTQLLWPSVTRIDGQLPELFWFTAVVSAALVSPILEELAFRGVILPALSARGTSVGVVLSSIIFAAFHVTQSLGSGVSAALTAGLTSLSVGLITGFLVATTGRLAPAIGVHIVYNASWVVLVLAS